MMRPSNDLPAVYLCREVVDFRKGINGLAVLVEEALEEDPFSEQLFVFCNRRRDRVRILYWERNGFCLWQKRLEKARFHWPRRETGCGRDIHGSAAELVIGWSGRDADEATRAFVLSSGFLGIVQ